MKFEKKFSQRPKAVAITMLAGIMGFGSLGFPLAANAMASTNNMSAQTYVSHLHALNSSQVTGKARFVERGRELTATINATGLQPGVHPIHIHGKDQAKAECPTMSNDTNGDGFLSVIEGAPAYGLIKLNLTSPQTAFGKPPTPVLFYPFAGTANNSNFPVVGSNGKLHFKGSYMFDNSVDAQAAFQSLTPLGNQAVVIHGGVAPQSVDAPAFAALGSPRPAGYDPALKTYDPLLPVACGTIKAKTNAASSSTRSQSVSQASSASMQTLATSQLMNTLTTDQAQLSASNAQATQQITVSGQNQALSTAVASFTTTTNNMMSDFTTLTTNAVATYNAAIASGTNADVARNQLIDAVASAKDNEVNGLYNSRNQLIDQLNQSGLVSARDAFLNAFDNGVNNFGTTVEQVKNQL